MEAAQQQPSYLEMEKRNPTIRQLIHIDTTGNNYDGTTTYCTGTVR